MSVNSRSASIDLGGSCAQFPVQPISAQGNFHGDITPADHPPFYLTPRASRATRPAY